MIFLNHIELFLSYSTPFLGPAQLEPEINGK